MKQEMTSNGIRVIIADDGLLLRRKGEDDFANKVYLAFNDSQDNYEEISVEDAKKIEEQKDIERKLARLKDLH